MFPKRPERRKGVPVATFSARVVLPMAPRKRNKAVVVVARASGTRSTMGPCPNLKKKTYYRIMNIGMERYLREATENMEGRDGGVSWNWNGLESSVLTFFFGSYSFLQILLSLWTLPCSFAFHASFHSYSTIYNLYISYTIKINHSMCIVSYYN